MGICVFFREFGRLFFVSITGGPHKSTEKLRKQIWRIQIGFAKKPLRQCQKGAENMQFRADYENKSGVFESMWGLVFCFVNFAEQMNPGVAVGCFIAVLPLTIGGS